MKDKTKEELLHNLIDETEEVTTEDKFCDYLISKGLSKHTLDIDLFNGIIKYINSQPLNLDTIVDDNWLEVKEPVIGDANYFDKFEAYQQARSIRVRIDELVKENNALNILLKHDKNGQHQYNLFNDINVQLATANSEIEQLTKEKDKYYNKAVQLSTDNDIQAEKLIELTQELNELKLSLKNADEVTEHYDTSMEQLRKDKDKLKKKTELSVALSETWQEGYNELKEVIAQILFHLDSDNYLEAKETALKLKSTGNYQSKIEQLTKERDTYKAKFENRDSLCEDLSNSWTAEKDKTKELEKVLLFIYNHNELCLDSTNMIEDKLNI